MKDIQIRTIWTTACEHCEIVSSDFNGYRLRLWVQGRLLVDDLMADLEAALERGWELRIEWPSLVE